MKKKAIKNDSKSEILKVLKNNLKHLAIEGGGIEIVKVDKKNGVVEIRMAGACYHCPMRQFTFGKMIAEELKKNLAWLKDVKLIE